MGGSSTTFLVSPTVSTNHLLTPTINTNTPSHGWEHQATGGNTPTFRAPFHRPPNNTLSQQVSSSKRPRGSDPSSLIIDEIGDGARPLRAISGRVFNDPGHHVLVRQRIVSHISQNHDIFLHITPTVSITNRSNILGHPPRYHNSLQEYA